MRETASTRNVGTAANSGKASLQSLPLHSELLDFSSFLEELDDFALEEDPSLELDFAELELDFSLDEDFAEELLSALLELSGLMDLKFAIIVVSE